MAAFGDELAAPVEGEADDATCTDVGVEHRVCFGERVAAAARPRPLAPIPPDGIVRCEGSGAERACTLSRARPFRRTDERTFEQAPPRVPDDGEWECADVDGVVVCRGWSDAAGVAAGPVERGWICGPPDAASRRICVDLAPDVPPALGERATCRFHHEPSMRRVCRAATAPRLDASCVAGADCPRAMACVSGFCAPLVRPVGDCWTTADCSEGAECVLATCTAG